MKIKSVLFLISASVEFSRRDIESLLLCSRNHYDHKCKELSMPGGLLNGLNNKLTLCPSNSTQCNTVGDAAEWSITTYDADLLAKCAEYVQYLDDADPSIHVKMVRILNELTAQQNEANGVAHEA
jgi:hypothetical protein